MAQNMYRVGDYVYFETSPSAPYQVRRIEELNKTQTGAVEAKVTCFFRRRDLPNSLLKIADQAERQSQILSKPRKSLLFNTTIDRAAETNGGEATDQQPKENGVVETSSSSGGEHRHASAEPEDVKKEADEEKEEEEPKASHGQSKSYGFAGLPAGAEKLQMEQLHELRQRELFLSRVAETLPATQIRGKCAVVILNEVETCEMYLGQEDSFFYSLVYDPSNQTLLADKGRIEIGERHQAVIPDLITEQEEEEENAKNEEAMDTGEEKPKESASNAAGSSKQEVRGVQQTERERVVYHPYHNLRDLEIDQFLLVARAIGTFSRALDSSSSTKLPTLHQTASAASRDITLLHAMALLHQANYDLGQATKYLVPPADKQHYPLEADRVTSHNTSNLGGPILCRDQLEEWSASESTLFEEAVEKYGKDFHDIRLDCLPWKSMRDIVEYYYMWKTTSRYAELQKAKRAEQENKLKQVYISQFNKPHVNMVSGGPNQQELIKSSSPCESCAVGEAAQWYQWGPSQQLRICGECWTVWKKRGGLKKPHELETYDLDGADQKGSGTGPAMNRFGLGRNGLAALPKGPTAGQLLIGQKGRVAFYLNSPLETRLARRMAPKHVFNVRKAARAPFHKFDLKAVQDFYFTRPIGEVINTVRQLKRGAISERAKDHLIKLHKKKATTTGPSTASSSAQENGSKN